MKILDRYAEYAIIGGLFWIGLFIFATLVQPSGRDIASMWTGWIDVLAGLPKFDNGVLSSVISSLLSALAVIAVFCTGMLIDVISPYFFALLEILYFRHIFIKKNYNYIENIFKDDRSSSIYDDYMLFSTNPIFRNIAQWWLQLSRYTRLLTLLTSYCLKNSGAGLLEDLKDRLVLWKTGRALGGSILFLVLVVDIFLIFFNLQIENPLVVVMLILFLILPFLLAMGQYILMCNALGSIMHLTDNEVPSIK